MPGKSNVIEDGTLIPHLGYHFKAWKDYDAFEFGSFDKSKLSDRRIMYGWLVDLATNKDKAGKIRRHCLKLHGNHFVIWADLPKSERAVSV